MATAVFDPTQYKQTTRAQWQGAAEAWHRWGPTLERWLGPATEQMLDMAGIRTGYSVLDVAAGAGGQTLAAARRVGPSGRVLATDISPMILQYAVQAAWAEGLTQVSMQELDGENLDVPADHFDAVISRAGLIYFPDQQKALAGMRRALKPGGRVAAIVYSTAESNKFFSIPVSIIRRRAQLPPPLAGQPGPFSLGGPDVLQSVLEHAGFREVQTHTVPAPLLVPSAVECVRFERESFGALHQMLSGLGDDEKNAAWAEIERQLTQYETASGFAGPCELVIGVGVK
ncbi:MAG: class I SAM-dependent methyltransferase [Anaerolineales bacterium]